MNRSQLTRTVAEKLELDPKIVGAVYTEIVDNILECLSQGESVGLMGFGTFTVTHAAERTAHNPRTRELMTIPAHTRPVFKFGQSARTIVNNPRP